MTSELRKNLMIRVMDDLPDGVVARVIEGHHGDLHVVCHDPHRIGKDVIRITTYQRDGQKHIEWYESREASQALVTALTEVLEETAPGSD